MKRLIKFAILGFLLTGCAHTYVERIDGNKVTVCGNGWEEARIEKAKESLSCEDPAESGTSYQKERVTGYYTPQGGTFGFPLTVQDSCVQYQCPLRTERAVYIQKN